MAQLRLRLSAYSAADWSGEDEAAERWREEFSATLAGAMAVCGLLYSHLRELCLELDISCHLHLGSWLAGLASLQRFEVTSAMAPSSLPVRCAC